jgi:hypothetical protein
MPLNAEEVIVLVLLLVVVVSMMTIIIVTRADGAYARGMLGVTAVTIDLMIGIGATATITIILALLHGVVINYM